MEGSCPYEKTIRSLVMGSWGSCLQERTAQSPGKGRFLSMPFSWGHIPVRGLNVWSAQLLTLAQRATLPAANPAPPPPPGLPPQGQTLPTGATGPCPSDSYFAQ